MADSTFWQRIGKRRRFYAGVAVFVAIVIALGFILPLSLTEQRPKVGPGPMDERTQALNFAASFDDPFFSRLGYNVKQVEYPTIEDGATCIDNPPYGWQVKSYGWWFTTVDTVIYC